MGEFWGKPITRLQEFSMSHRKYLTSQPGAVTTSVDAADQGGSLETQCPRVLVGAGPIGTPDWHGCDFQHPEGRQVPCMHATVCAVQAQ